MSLPKLAYFVDRSNAGEVIDKQWWHEGEEVLYTCAREPLASNYAAFPEEKRTSDKDLLLTRNGTPYVHLPTSGAIYSNVVQRITLAAGNSRRYFLYALQISADEMRGYGVSIESLNYDMWANRRFAVPRLPDQERIANFLDEQTARIDALIAEKERLLETLDEHRYAHLSRVMTIGLDASAALIQTSFPELRSIPRHWTVKRLKFLGEVRSGIAKGKDHGERDTVMLPYLRVANVQDGYVDLTDVQEIEVGSREVDRYLLRAGDVLMNEGGDNDKLGRGTVWEGQIAPCVHQNHVFAVRLRNAELGEWVARFTSTDAARTYFFLRSKQSTNLASINQSNVRELPIPMPPEEERRDILTEVRRSEEATASLLAHTREHIDRLREYRSSLISAAINGQLNIDAFEARPLEAA